MKIVCITIGVTYIFFPEEIKSETLKFILFKEYSPSYVSILKITFVCIVSYQLKFQRISWKRTIRNSTNIY